MARSTICCQVRFVASSFCGCVGAWKEVRFFPLVLRFCGSMARSECVASSFCGCVGAWQEVRIVAFSFCGCVGVWQEVRFAASIFVVLWGHGKKYDLLPLVFWFCRGMARNTICCL